MASEMLLGATVLQQPAADPAAAKSLFDKLVFQGLKEVAMHEVGHTLGLRHNFKASKIYDPEMYMYVGGQGRDTPLTITRK